MRRQNSIFQVVVAMVIAMLFVACVDKSGFGAGHSQSDDDSQTVSKIDSLLNVAYGSGLYDRVLVLADSLEERSELSATAANYWRGKASVNKGQYRLAEFYYQKVIASNDKDATQYYVRTLCNLTNLLLLKRDYEGALHVTLPALTKLEHSKDISTGELADLLAYTGCCQVKLGRMDEAKTSLGKAFDSYLQAVKNDTVGIEWLNAVGNTHNISVSYSETKHYADALHWEMRADSLLSLYEQTKIASAPHVDNFRGHIQIGKAVSLQKLNRPAEAKDAYEAYLKTDMSKWDANSQSVANYLSAAHEYDRAADVYASLDEMIHSWNIQLSLDNIVHFYSPKYRANVNAARKDSALLVGMQIVNALDSAVVWQKESDAAELATIYSTQQKETEIAEKNAELSRQRLIGTAITASLLLLFFVIYTIYRNRMHKELQTAYDKLEETTIAKERMESELRIARDIQMSMVPHTFPQRPDLDLYASMTPAREVGGDLYGYLLEDTMLYFCVGDVSGKGVPASLLMAQATRLFRTLAAQHMMPAEMATRMNAVLAEDNEQGMFITMFIGLVDLTSGHMSYCNAGHNPPVLGNKFLKMESNAPIGLWSELKYVGEETNSIKGSPLLVYTDGLTEAENLQLKQFGERRLLDSMGDTSQLTAKQIIKQLESEVDGYRNGADPNDDLTMMCVRVV